MPNFQNGKIYKIVNDSSDLVYYGSTTQPLYKRFYRHKTIGYKCSSKKIFEGENPQIILVESYPCNNKDELTRRERFFIENNICVNRNIPGRTDREWREDNKNNIKKYYQDNKEIISEKKKIYRQKNKEIIKEKKKDYYQNNKEIISEKKKIYFQDNKEIIKEKNKVKITCICGSSFRKYNLPRHEKTKKHLEYISNN